MGLTKKEHIQELLRTPETAAQLEGATVQELYEEFLEVGRGGGWGGGPGAKSSIKKGRRGGC